MNRGNATVEARPYHHGDLRRALVGAARRLLESEGQSALSLRAVAREAGVSPAAPYHHFRDKSDLLGAVAAEGWEMLDAALAVSRDEAASPQAALLDLGVAYVCFARENPALYRVMYDTASDLEALPDRTTEHEDSAYCQVRRTMVAAGADPSKALDLELSTVAAWCSAHGLADMANFKQFAALKDSCGGEKAFLSAVFGHLGLVPAARRD